MLILACPRMLKSLLELVSKRYVSNSAATRRKRNKIKGRNVVVILSKAKWKKQYFSVAISMFEGQVMFLICFLQYVCQMEGESELL